MIFGNLFLQLKMTFPRLAIEYVKQTVHGTKRLVCAAPHVCWFLPGGQKPQLAALKNLTALANHLHYQKHTLEVISEAVSRYITAKSIWGKTPIEIERTNENSGN